LRGCRQLLRLGRRVLQPGFAVNQSKFSKCTLQQRPHLFNTGNTIELGCSPQAISRFRPANHCFPQVNRAVFRLNLAFPAEAGPFREPASRHPSIPSGFTFVRASLRAVKAGFETPVGEGNRAVASAFYPGGTPTARRCAGSTRLSLSAGVVLRTTKCVGSRALIVVRGAAAPDGGRIARVGLERVLDHHSSSMGPPGDLPNLGDVLRGDRPGRRHISEAG
jgi:hypothetical protein